MARQIRLLEHRSAIFSPSGKLLQIAVSAWLAVAVVQHAVGQQATPTPASSPKPQLAAPAPATPTPGGLRTPAVPSPTPGVRNPVASSTDPAKTQKPNRPSWLAGKAGDDPEQRAFLQTLTPEQRQQFHEKLERWKTLPPEQRAELRKNEEFRQQRILKEINDAIARSGLQLDQDQRQLFTFRFAQERRTIEEDLRKELEEKRTNAVNQLIADLVTEFKNLPPKGTVGSPPPAGSGTSTPPSVITPSTTPPATAAKASPKP